MKKVLVASLLFASISVSAGFIDGKTLYDFLTSQDPAKQTFASGYVGGVADQLQGTYYCPPNTVTIGQLKALTGLALEHFKDDLDKPADIFVRSALMSSFPCKTQPRTGSKSTSI
jgi:hypothetical protein